MLQALSLILPICLAGAISPVLLTEQTVLLAGPGGRKAARGFAVGAVGTLLVIVLVLVFFGHVIELPKRPTLSASLDIVFGVALLLAGAALHGVGRVRARTPEERKAPREARPEAALPFGIFSMATNFTTLALVFVIAKQIAAADVSTVERLVLILAPVVICSLPAWAPLAVTRAAPRTGEAALKALGDFIDRHGRTAIVVLLAVAGVYLLQRGVFGI